jgi:hypothetical protein
MEAPREEDADVEGLQHEDAVLHASEKPVPTETKWTTRTVLPASVLHPNARASASRPMYPTNLSLKLVFKISFHMIICF